MSDTSAYQVLARKYRPETFADLIGQEAMVRTLRNAFKSGRIAHAFILTGIRGTGKTTTARIIAKGLNCIGPDGTGGPTTSPCGVCEPCRAIAAGRHVDVLEMDAASRTGVGDIREIIDSVAYRAASARHKVYIIDEVHMLSTNAFNALLKTLEEPPAHVKFLFATTEIRKVPVTVLSRCQRFDLRRIEPEVMMAHLGRISEAEGAEVAAEALAMITRAAEGSVRDALSLLDQAISHGQGATSAEAVRAMLGLADRGRVMDLLDLILRGDCAGALRELGGQYADGADPIAVLRDLAEVTHWVSVVKITPDASEDPTVSSDERARGRDMAERLPMRVLSRMWQMLLKALEEVAHAPNAMMAAEMAVIRMTHVADLPGPEELMRKLADPATPAARAPHGPAGGNGGGPQARHGPAAGTPAATSPGTGPGPIATARALAPAQAAPSLSAWPDFDSVVALIRDRRDMPLLMEVEADVRLVHYAPGRIEFAPTDTAAPDLAARLAQRLRTWTGARWTVSVTGSGGAPTIREARRAAEGRARATARDNPLVQAILAVFPTAEITDIRPLAPPEAILPAAPDDDPAAGGGDDIPDDWDPFEDD
ncbi:DNA polymerase III subunit gamma/tau [Rhodobaculum claviforme]|uniref:DNA polymerase III subunit gamma/tau n=1 Tax=Rhodobaculum claviforme TaxID=1549854 RepID=A0A934WHJ9_9RHOB|nr:DNA polymerase III subunit gamma/tau [Rhodobaculum claviforme]